MRVFISADMEGISGACMREDFEPGHPRYEKARLLLTADVNAVVAGAIEGGADDLIVADMHDGGANFVFEQLDDRARYLIGGPHWPRFPYLDKGIDAFFLVAYHARANTPEAVADHTFSSEAWQKLEINGQEVGEIAVDASIAGYYGVPTVFVSGDDKVAAEARALFGPIETPIVKYGVARHRALFLPLSKARAGLREAARRAVGLVGKIKPLRFEPPYELRLTYSLNTYADGRHFDNHVTFRDGGRTVVVKGNDLMECFARLWA
jgi:D-amino peptidase